MLLSPPCPWLLDGSAYLKGYNSSWESKEGCKNKELYNLSIAHLQKNSGVSKKQSPAFGLITSLVNFSCTTGFTLSLLSSAGLQAHTRLTCKMEQFVEQKKVSCIKTTQQQSKPTCDWNYRGISGIKCNRLNRRLASTPGFTPLSCKNNAMRCVNCK